MFNGRQLLGLSAGGAPLRRAGGRASATPWRPTCRLLRYQNMLCRYDTRSLQSLDIFPFHGFPVGLVQAESTCSASRTPGPPQRRKPRMVDVVQKFLRAKEYCDRPFEIRYSGRSKHVSRYRVSGLETG